VLFRVGHPNVRVGLNSYSEAERVYAAASLGRLPTPNSEEPEASVRDGKEPKFSQLFLLQMSKDLARCSCVFGVHLKFHGPCREVEHL